MKKLIIYLVAATFVGAILFAVKMAQTAPPDHHVVIDGTTGKVKEFQINGHTVPVGKGSRNLPQGHPDPVSPETIQFIKGNCFYYNGYYYC